MIELWTMGMLSYNVLLLVFLSTSSNAQDTPNTNNTDTTGNTVWWIIAGWLPAFLVIWMLVGCCRGCGSRSQVGVTIPPGQSRIGGSSPAPSNGFQSPVPSYNPPVAGYNESYSYPPNYAAPTYGKDGRPGSQPYPPPSGPLPLTNQNSYTSVKPPSPPAPAHVTGQDGAGGPWSKPVM